MALETGANALVVVDSGRKEAKSLGAMTVGLTWGGVGGRRE